MQYMDMGIDISLTEVIICIRDKGVVLREPSTTIYDENTGKVVDAGLNCFRADVALTNSQEVFWAIDQTKWSDPDIAAQVLKYFINKALGNDIPCKLRVVVSVPLEFSQKDRSIVKDAVLAAGAADIIVIDAPIAVSVGARDDDTTKKNSIIVSINGGDTCVAGISRGKIVKSASIPVNMEDFDWAILYYINDKYRVMIEDYDAEDIKNKIGFVNSDSDIDHFDVHGDDLFTYLPKTISVSVSEVADALQKPTEKIEAAIQSTFEQLVSEYAAEISDCRIVLTGRGVFPGLDLRISNTTGIKSVIADDPLTVAAVGACKYWKHCEEHQ